MAGILAIYVNSKSFTVAGDQTSDFDIGRRVKCIGSNTWYGTIESSLYTTLTTVTLTATSDNLESSLTEVYYGIVSGNEGSSATNIHTHDGDEGSGGQISHTNLSNIGTNTHAQIDTAITNSTNHIADTSNPHSVTKTQIGLSNVPNTDFTSAVNLNTAKVTNATHTGEVTGDTTLTIADNIIDEDNLKLDDIGVNDQVLTYDDTKSGNMKWGTAGSGGVTDHGALNGLADDDHTQYHNDTRGDARYDLSSTVDTKIDTDISTHAALPDAHHNESHTIASHSDTTATGVELETLTGSGDTTLHYHSTDRDRSNHTGTQTASTISDFDTEVSNNTDVAANTAKRTYPITDETKVGYLTVTQAVDLDTMESDVTTNNAKVTNATHTGEVTGTTELTIAENVVGETKLLAGNAPINGYVLSANSIASGGLEWIASIDPMTTRGDIIVRNASNVTDRLVIGTAEQVLTSDGTDVSWSDPSISQTNGTDLTDGGDTTLHYHSTDRDRSNHTGTQLASTISDFDTEVSNNTDVAANTAKVTNATHTGHVIGSGTLNISDNVVKEAHLRLDTGPTNDYVLTADSAATGGMKWAANSAGFSDPMTTRGDIIIRDSSNSTTRLPLGSADYVLTSDGTDIGWVAASSGGNVYTTGLPVANDFARFYDSTHIEGRSYSEVKTDLAIVASDISDFDTEVSNNTDVVANTAKVSNATHSGEVNGDTTLIISTNVIDEDNLKLDTGPTNDYVLTADSTKSGGMKWAAPVGGDVVDDTTPQLGGDLDLNEHYIQLEPSPSADDTGSGEMASMTVDVNAVGVGAALYMASDGNFEEADANASTTLPCMALALETSTGTKKVLLKGFMRNDGWNFTSLGQPVYVSTTQGTLTQTAPSTSGEFVQRVGIATHSDRIWFSPDFTVIEVA